jgi:hypothetical protein
MARPRCAFVHRFLPFLAGEQQMLLPRSSFHCN